MLVNGVPTLAPSGTPTTNRMLSGVREQLERGVLFLRNETFAALDEDDPRARALDWILHDDALQLESNDVNLYQRFVLAVVAYALNSGAWYNCGVASRRNGSAYNESQCLLLRDGATWWNCKDRALVLGENATEEECFYSSVWLSSTPECSWFGAICSGDGTLRAIR